MNKKVLAIIPARAGSKGVPDKNIKDINEKPLIAWTLIEAQKSKIIDKIIVSTDSSHYASLCKNFGVDVPFIRPSNISNDKTSSEEVVIHAIKWLETKNNYTSDYILLLQPTSPLRTLSDIDLAINIAYEKNADSVVSVEKVIKHPHYMRRINKDGLLENYTNRRLTNIRRQDLDEVFVLNGAIFLVKTEVILNGSWYGNECYPIIMPQERSIEIDSQFDFYLSDLIMKDKNEY
jgi:CMP-N,N'-diacetyllegionaminic acid synthase